MTRPETLIFIHPQYVAEVMRPLRIDDIIDQEVQNLSGGELQRLALALCLGKPVDVYLMDEPSGKNTVPGLSLPGQRAETGGCQGHQEVHTPRKENWLQRGARLHHGDVPGGQGHRGRGPGLRGHSGSAA